MENTSQPAETNRVRGLTPELSPAPTGAQRTWLVAACIFVIGLAACLRWIGRDAGLWFDEFLSLEAALADNLVAGLRATDHPPLYFLLLRIWAFFGTGEAHLRTLSVLFGVAMVIVVVVWVWRYSPRAAPVAGLLAATLPMMLRYSHEIRHYQLLMLACAGAMAFASAVAQSPRRWWPYVGLGGCFLAAASTHLVTIIFVPAVVVFVLTSQEPDKRVSRMRLAGVLVPALVAWIYFRFFFLRAIGPTAEWWMPEVSINLLGATMRYVAGFSSALRQSQAGFAEIPHPLAAIFLQRLAELLSIAVLIPLAASGPWRRSRPFLLAAATYWLGLIMVSIIAVPVFWYRTVLPGLVPMIAFLAIHGVGLRERWRRIAVMATVALVCTAYAANWVVNYAGNSYEQWREIAAAVDSSWTDGSLLLVFPDYAVGPLSYYTHLADGTNVVAVPLGSDTEQLARRVSVWNRSASAGGDPRRILLVTRWDVHTRDHPVRRGLPVLLESQFGPPVNSTRLGVLSLLVYEPPLP